MTEPEWLSAVEPRPMLAFLAPHLTERKVRLFAVACCRHLGELIHHASSVAAVDLAELAADGGVPRDQLLDASLLADDYFGSTCVYGTSTGDQAARTAVAASAATADEILHLHFLSFRYPAPQIRAAHADFLRDIFGNPFRPVGVDAAWRTSAVLGLCRQVYDTRDFTAMPILADALQDAGCADEQVLAHCRHSAPHTRGCWVVDLLSGRA
jgi:hypothetical protein